MARILIGNIKGPQGIQGNDGGIGPVGPVGPPGPMGEVDNNTPIEFTEAEQRENLASGDAIKVLFGKTKKFFSDLKSVAFSGSYNDLTGKPSIPSTPAEIGAASEGIGMIKFFILEETTDTIGWYRVAEGTMPYCANTIFIGKIWGKGIAEAHKVEVIRISKSCIIKSIYSMSDSDAPEIKKIRIVGGGNKSYLDVYYNNPGASFKATVTIENNFDFSNLSHSWKFKDSLQIVPETTEGETVLAELEFGSNSWLGGLP